MDRRTKAHIILVLIVWLLTGISISQSIKIKNYENGFNIIQKETRLHKCSRCEGNEINIIPTKSGLYLECDDCHLRTYKSDSLKELVKFWNREERITWDVEE